GEGTLGALVDEGHWARRAYETAQEVRPDSAVSVTPGAPGWIAELRAAGAAGLEVRPSD
ncbi:prephenate dehydrogenase, partial [Dietzia sp. DQ11-38-2]|nr:prephenate dehydrogenase [Dietzia sp. DQ11-38-2]